MEIKVITQVFESANLTLIYIYQLKKLNKFIYYNILYI